MEKAEAAFFKGMQPLLKDIRIFIFRTGGNWHEELLLLVLHRIAGSVWR